MKAEAMFNPLTSAHCSKNSLTRKFKFCRMLPRTAFQTFRKIILDFDL